MKYFVLGFAMLVLVVVLVAGLRGPELRRFTSPPIEIFPDMDRQPKYKSQKQTGFFADGRIDRAPVSGTVPYGKPLKTSYYGSGLIEGNWGDGFPEEVEVTPALLERGRERYNINCAVCHGPAGGGDGVTSKYGLVGIANFHQPMFVEMTDGQIFYTISNGKGQMGPYRHIKVRDRWAIVAYVRALQRARMGRADELPGEMLQELQ